MDEPTATDLVATAGSPTVLAPAPLLPAELKICMLNSSIVRLYSSARALLPSLRAAYSTPSIRPLDVHDVVARHTLTAITWAPGATPAICPPNRPLPVAM